MADCCRPFRADHSIIVAADDRDLLHRRKPQKPVRQQSERRSTWTWNRLPGTRHSRMAHVSVSRAQLDVQMLTNDAKALGYELNRDVSHPTAIQKEPVAAQQIEPQVVGMGNSQGMSAG